jgi:hypothetical protein
MSLSPKTLPSAVGLFLCAMMGGIACGENAPPPKTEESAANQEAPKGEHTKPSGPVVEQELGSIDPRAVQKTFDQLLNGKLEACHSQGRGRVEYLSGEAKVFLRVGKDGKVKYGFFDDSTIGERATEKCVLDVLFATEWPKPIGGEAEIRSSFGWSAGGERQPASWEPDKVASALAEDAETRGAIDKCKAGVSGAFHVTAYVEPGEVDRTDAAGDGKGDAKGDQKKTDAKKRDAKKPDGKKGDPKKGDDKDRKSSNHGGKFKSVGVSVPGKEGAEKADCIVDALKNLSLPTPGSYAAKVTFTL